MWTYIKRGFGYGFGGRIGWETGGLVWGAIRKIVGIVGLGLGAMFGLPAVSDSIGTYHELKAKYAAEAQDKAKSGKSAVLRKEVRGKQKTQ